MLQPGGLEPEQHQRFVGQPLGDREVQTPQISGPSAEGFSGRRLRRLREHCATVETG
jgi:hypothetical protein